MFPLRLESDHLFSSFQLSVVDIIILFLGPRFFSPEHPRSTRRSRLDALAGDQRKRFAGGYSVQTYTQNANVATVGGLCRLRRAIEPWVCVCATRRLGYNNIRTITGRTLLNAHSTSRTVGTRVDKLHSQRNPQSVLMYIYVR